MRIPVLVLTILALALPAAAQECTPTTSHPEVSFLGLYVDNDLCQPDDCLFSVWIYHETNNIEGLQRFDDVVDDTCGGMIDGDSFPFL